MKLSRIAYIKDLAHAGVNLFCQFLNYRTFVRFEIQKMQHDGN